jgi:hypothetical protein
MQQALCAAQHSAAQHSRVPHGTGRFSTTTAQHRTTRQDMAQYSTAQHSMWIASAYLQHQICFIVCQECNIGQVQLACVHPFFQFGICANNYMRVCVSRQTPAAAACCHSCLLTMQAAATTVAIHMIPVNVFWWQKAVEGWITGNLRTNSICSTLS